jgi:aminotransferase MxcL
MKQVKELKLNRSQEMAAKNEKLIAGFTQTMMKKPEQFAPGKFPMFLDSGKGAVVRDVDGQEYIDYICALAANSLGHAHPAIIKAISTAMEKGISHSLPTEYESRAAEALLSLVPNVEMARFFKTGADANSAAIRLARHITKRDEIVTIGYNGWHDQYMFDTPGVPQTLAALTHRMPLMTPMDEEPLFELLGRRADQLAAVLISIPYNRRLTSEFYQRLRRVCSEKGIILIYDEVMSGFRIAAGGAQEFFGVPADLVTFSKALAAGLPLSAVAGSRQLMEKMSALQVSTTFGGETLSLAACEAALGVYRDTDYFAHIHRLGKRLREGVNLVSKELGTPLEVVGYDPIPMFLFAKNPVEHVRFAEPFLAEMAKRGVIMRREVNFICAAHTGEQIEHTIGACGEALEAMKSQGIFN